MVTLLNTGAYVLQNGDIIIPDDHEAGKRLTALLGADAPGKDKAK